MEKFKPEGMIDEKAPTRLSHVRTFIHWVVETDKEFRVRQSMMDDCKKW